MENESKRPSLLNNRALVLLCIATDSQVSICDLAASTNTAEGTVRHIIAELEAVGYLRRMRVGRRNVYEIIDNIPLRPLSVRGMKVQKMLELIVPVKRRRRS